LLLSHLLPIAALMKRCKTCANDYNDICRHARKERKMLLKRSRLLIMFALITAVVGIQSATAQAKTTPLPLFVALNNGQSRVEGDIFAWNNGFTKKTLSSHNDVPVVSPAGDWIAFTSVPAFYVAQRPPNDEHTAAKNIQILKLTGTDSRLIADQPPKASLKDGKVAYTIRSVPSWSPDGKALVWTEVTTNQTSGVNPKLQDEQLVIYTVDTKKQQIIVPKLPQHYFIGDSPYMSKALWGAGGIAVLTKLNEQEFAVTVYDASGKQLSQTDPLAGSGFDISAMIWIKDADHDYISNVGGRIIIDPQSGKTDDMNGIPELYSPTAAANGMSLAYGNASANEANTRWNIFVNGKAVDSLDSIIVNFGSEIAISPDGQSLAYILFPGQGSNGGLFVYQKGKSRDLGPANVMGLAWSPQAWRVFHFDPNA